MLRSSKVGGRWLFNREGIVCKGPGQDAACFIGETEKIPMWLTCSK